MGNCAGSKTPGLGLVRFCYGKFHVFISLQTVFREALGLLRGKAPYGGSPLILQSASFFYIKFINKYVFLRIS